MIEFEKVMQEIDKTKKRLTSAKARIPGVEEKIFKLTQKFTDLVIDDAPDKAFEKVRDEISKSEKELELLVNLDTDEEFKKALGKDNKTKMLIDEFIKQQEELLEKLVEEEKPYGESVLEAFGKVIKAVKERRKFLGNMSTAANQLCDVKRAAGFRIPLMGELAYYQTKITKLAFDKWLNKIRTADGRLPKY